MEKVRAVGRHASAKKYDLLTALSLLALHGRGHDLTCAARLSLLVTARYNWQNDELTLAQEEIAKLWGVDPRTVKREMARYRERKWLVLKRPAARGRVATYGLGQQTILENARVHWAHVGQDFVERADGMIPKPSVVKVDFGQKPTQVQDVGWDRMAQHLKLDDPAIYANWFRRLTCRGVRDGELIFETRSTFVARYIETHLIGRLLNAAHAEGIAMDGIRIFVV